MFVPAPEIFKAYDIRGIVDKTLTVEAVRAIGHALGSEAVARNQKAIAVGRDGRLSGPALAGALAMPEEAREALAADALAFAQRRDAEALAGLSRIVEMAP